jgi:hypothetical protein
MHARSISLVRARDMEGGEVAHTQERARRYTPTYTITPIRRPSPLFSTSFYPLFCHPRRSRNFWMVAYLFQASHSSLESIQKSLLVPFLLLHRVLGAAEKVRWRKSPLLFARRC